MTTLLLRAPDADTLVNALEVGDELGRLIPTTPWGGEEGRDRGMHYIASKRCCTLYGAPIVTSGFCI